MTEYPAFVERIWKRPVDVAPFPNIWSRFEVKLPESGHIRKIRIQDLTPDRYDEVWDMYAKHFYAEEELVKSAKEVEDEVTMVSQRWAFDQCVKENLSIIATLDNDDPKPVILGGLQLAVTSKDDPQFPTLPGEARAKVHNLFKILCGSIDAFKILGVDHYLKDHGLVVKPEYKRQGIGTQLFRTMEQMAKTFEIPAAVIIFNNITSQALGVKLGYTVLNEVKISDYVDENGQLILPTVNTKVVQLCYRRFS